MSHRSSLNINILHAPATVLDDYVPTQFQLENAQKKNEPFEARADNLYINEHNIENTFKGKTLAVLNDIMDAVKDAGDWFDRSDSQSDYFHVAFWIHMGFGSRDKECELIGRRRVPKTGYSFDEAQAMADELGVDVVEGEPGQYFPEASSFIPDESDLDRESAVHTDDRATVVPLFKPVLVPEFTLAEKIAIARAEMIRRYKSAFAATPVGATLNEYSLSVLAEAALQVTVD